MNLCKDCEHYVPPTSSHPLAVLVGPVYVVAMCGHPDAQRDVVAGELATTAKEARYGSRVGEPLCGVDAKLFERRAIRVLPMQDPASTIPGSISYVPAPEPTRSTWERVKGWFI
jgi:hypothetical protein